MQRVYAVVKEEIVHLIDDRAKVTGITRSQWICKAIESFLHGPGDDRITQEVTTLTAKLEESISKADYLKGELRVKEGELAQLKNDAELKWRETNQLRSEVTQTKRELESVRSKADQLQAELDKKRTEEEQSRIETEALKRDQAHFQDTIKLRDQHISFLEATVHQALEKLPKSLPPSQEGAKKWLVAILAEG